jgi:tRNA dimethylallyltransferase
VTWSAGQNLLDKVKYPAADFMSDRQKLVFICGPTGVGKTELAARAAEGIGEIISVDSMQVYRQLDLGTSKPDVETQRRVPHHLLSIVGPDYRFSAGDFRRRALSTIEEIRSRGRIPFLVGGTGLYFKALEFHFSEAPKADVSLRDRLYREEERCKGLLYRRLVEVDPVTALRLHPNDQVRIVRALEIHTLSGRKPSEFVTGQQEPQFDILKIGLLIERESLYDKLERRCVHMVRDGLPAEVHALLRRGYDERYPSMKGLGYGHFVQYFKGCLSNRETLRLFIRDTRHYAKRQLTWFRKDRAVSWYDPAEIEEICARILCFTRT